mgnify:CR=1 FL=1
MEKASVVIGFLTQRPRVDIPSYYEPVIVEKTYKGDISRSYRRNQQDYNSTIDSVILNEEFQIFFRYINYVSSHNFKKFLRITHS